MARNFVYFFALAPPVFFSILAALFDLDHMVGGDGIVLLMSGLAVIVAAGDLIPLRRQRFLRSVWAWIMAPALWSSSAPTLLQPWAGTRGADDAACRDIGRSSPRVFSAAPASRWRRWPAIRRSRH